MLAIARGDLAAPLPEIRGMDEVASMAKALTVFRDTAVEIRDQNLRERQVVLDTINYGVLILDPDLRVRMYNRAFRDLWIDGRDVVRAGAGMREVLEALRPTGLHGVPDERWQSYVERRLVDIRGADVPPREWHRPDGRVLQYEAVALPDGSRMLTYFDLTELKQVEGELRAAKEQAEMASRAKSDFLASMSHELRTPLNAIIGITEMLKEDAEADGDAHLDDALGRVLRAGRLLLQLINEILDLAKIEAGKLELQLEQVEIRSLLEDVVDTAKPLAEKHANILRLEVPSELGRGTIDPMRLRQILLNLLSNACKFTEQGEVSLVATRQDRHFEIRVRDTGIGIDADQMPSLFQEFHQAGIAKQRKYGGTGLGLAISRRLVTLMGGEINARSEKGKGSEFIVRLPTDTPIQAEAA
jgi:signal transduction histidine kinase